MVRTNYFVYRKLSSSADAIFKWYHNRAKWTIFTILAPAENMTNIDYEQSLIFLLLAVYDKQWSVSCEYTRPFILQPHQAPWWSQRTEHWPAWDANNESKLKENYKQLSKRSTDSFYQSFSSLFANHLKLHSRRYMFLRKRRSFEYRHCRCLARIAIALNRCSVYGQIQYTKPPEHLCLLNKLLQLVLVRVLTWSCYMIGVILIFQSLCQ